MIGFEATAVGVDYGPDITSATPKDIPGILEVQGSCALAEKLAAGMPPAAIERGGFLVHLVTEPELEALLTSPDVSALVRKDGDQVVGYALGYLLSSWRERNPEWSSTVTLRPGIDPNVLEDDKTFYARHVAMGPTAKPGAGAELSRRFVEGSIELGCVAVIGETLFKPYYNRPAQTINRKRLGLEDIGQVDEIYEGRAYGWTLFRRSLVE